MTAADHNFHLAIDGQAVGIVPRTTSREIHRHKAYVTLATLVRRVVYARTVQA
ncbi:MAG: hypothetical protein M3Y33_00730 [Actinomycetota bacterium]|nr:hypothetical protein [Actinomycetota bacterium]